MDRHTFKNHSLAISTQQRFSLVLCIPLSTMQVNMSVLKVRLTGFVMVGLFLVATISAAPIEPLIIDAVQIIDAVPIDAVPIDAVAIEPKANETFEVKPVATEPVANEAVANEAVPNDQVTTVVPPSSAIESTQPPTEVDTEIEQPLRCFCNLPECANTSSVCSTKLGCFTELRTHLTLKEVSAGQQGFDEDGASGCLEMTKIKKTCSSMLKSMEKPNSEFPTVQSQNISQDSINAYHCCQTDMCNDRTQNFTAQSIHEKIVVAYKSSMVVPAEESNATTMKVTVDPTAAPDAHQNVNSTDSPTDNKIAEAVESTTIYPDVITDVADVTTIAPLEFATMKFNPDLYVSKAQLAALWWGVNSTDESPSKKPEVLNKEDVSEKEEIIHNSTTIYPDVNTVVADVTTMAPLEFASPKFDPDMLASKVQLAALWWGKNSTDESPAKKPEDLNKEDVSEKEEIVATTTPAAVPELPLASSGQGEKEAM